MLPLELLPLCLPACLTAYLVCILLLLLLYFIQRAIDRQRAWKQFRSVVSFHLEINSMYQAAANAIAAAHNVTLP